MNISTRAFPPSGTQDIGVVYGVSCISTNFIKDTLAAFRNITVGGELKGYSEMIRKGIEQAQANLEEEAVKVNADGIYAVNIATPHITAGAAEIIMYGTAFKYV